MKKIDNKKTSMGTEEAPVHYKDLVVACVNSVDPQEGITASDMRLAIKVVEAAEKAPIKLEDAEFAFLKNKVNEMKWATPHKDIITFTDFINSL